MTANVTERLKNVGGLEIDTIKDIAVMIYDNK